MRARTRLRELRGKRTLREISAETGISVPMLSELERGTRIPSDLHAKVLTKSLKASVAVLWQMDGPWLAIEPDAASEAEDAA